MARRGPGQPRHFTDEQNRVLREALILLRKKKSLSQSKLGEELGVGQQAAGRLERSSDAGFSSATASRLVKALGYASPESFFRAKGVALSATG